MRLSTRRIITAVAATAAASAAVVLTAGAASAVTPTSVTITAGSAANGTAITLTGTAQPIFPPSTTNVVQFKDLRSGVTLQCTNTPLATTATASATVNPGQSPTGAVKITATSFNQCVGPLGLSFAVTGPSAASPWNVDATSTTVGGVTQLNITNVNAFVNGGATCTFPVTGTAPATYTNGASPLMAVATPGTTATATLTIGNVNGSPTGSCTGGIIRSGDKAQFTATYLMGGVVTATGVAANPVAVTAI